MRPINVRLVCTVVLASACGSANEVSTGEAATVVFRTDTAAVGATFGEVSVYPVGRAALAALESSAPAIEDWQRILSVRVATDSSRDSSALPLLGTYIVATDTLRFRPRFRPADGVSYVASFDGAALYARVKQSAPEALARVSTATWRHDAPAEAPSTVVREIYPTGDAVPMNLLRMYVEFSAPMSSGRSYDFVKLYAEGDSLLEEPFFTAGGAVELWDPERTRLTILFDPGRIKRDLKPHEEAGLPLREGKQYRLVIDSSWRDAQGRPLVRSHVKHFQVGAQDRSLVRTSAWRLTSPRPDSRDSLVVTFPEPLDRALLARMLAVRDSAGHAIEGEIVVSDRETRWAFAPRNPWRRHSYALHVDTELEDLAGNNLEKLFDVAPGDTAAVGVSASVVRLPFQPR